jgi:predicted O-methyltransferase YrrM
VDVLLAPGCNVGVASGWNLAARAASGAILVVANEDVLLKPATLDRLVEPFADDRVGLVGTRSSLWSQDHIRPISELSRWRRQRLHRVVLVPAGFLFAVRSKVWQSVGGFDDHLSPAFFEEADIAFRVAKTGAYTKDVPLDVVHDSGVSAWSSRRIVQWQGGDESVGDIFRRNYLWMLQQWTADSWRRNAMVSWTSLHAYLLRQRFRYVRKGAQQPVLRATNAILETRIRLPHSLAAEAWRVAIHGSIIRAVNATSRGGPVRRSVVRRVRGRYRDHLADRVDVLFARVDDGRFRILFDEVWPVLQWDHRPTARRLYLLAKEGPGEGAIVEIGSFLGNSTIFLAAGARSGRGEVVHAIDPHSPESMTQVPGDPDVSARFLSNLERFRVRDRVVYHRLQSVRTAAEWNAGPVRLLFVDGLHTYDSVRDDFNAWQPHLGSRWTVVFDDVLWPEVERAVADLKRRWRPPWSAVRGGQAIFSTHPLSVRIAGLL